MKTYDLPATELAGFGAPAHRTHRQSPGIVEETTRFSNDLGQGHYHDIYFDDVHIGYGSLRPRRPLRLSSQVANSTLEMHFLLEGSCASQLDALRPELVFRPGECNLLFLPGTVRGCHEVRSGQTCREFEVHLSGSFLQRLARAGTGAFTAFAQSMAHNQPALLSPPHLPISAAMRAVMQQIIDCPLAGAARRFLLEAKVVELLALLFEQAAPAGEVPASALRLRRPDTEKLHIAQAILLQSLSAPPTLPQLAAQCGLNEFKLKKGFKQLFGNTVYGYLLHHKLEKARHHLRTGEMTVAEIAEAVGYRYPSHFTAAFKKQYGVLPKDVRGNESARNS